MKIGLIAPYSLLQVPEIRDNPWVKEFFSDVDDWWVTTDPLPPGHFGTYFGLMGLRDYYPSEIFHDLFVIHDTAHTKMPYIAGQSHQEWSERMFKAELFASLISEVVVHFKIPGLRAKTFAHPIYADELLGNVELIRLASRESTYDEFIKRAYDARYNVMRAPDPDSFVHQQIHNYANQNHIWYDLWDRPAGLAPYGDMPAYEIVEQHMASPDRNETHKEWLASVSQFVTDPGGVTRSVPFAKQAALFEPYYKESGRRWGNHRFNKPVTTPTAR